MPSPNPRTRPTKTAAYQQEMTSGPMEQQQGKRTRCFSLPPRPKDCGGVSFTPGHLRGRRRHQHPAARSCGPLIFHEHTQGIIAALLGCASRPGQPRVKCRASTADPGPIVMYPLGVSRPVLSGCMGFKTKEMLILPMAVKPFDAEGYYGLPGGSRLEG